MVLMYLVARRRAAECVVRQGAWRHLILSPCADSSFGGGRRHASRRWHVCCSVRVRRRVFPEEARNRPAARVPSVPPQPGEAHARVDTPYLPDKGTGTWQKRADGGLPPWI